MCTAIPARSSPRTSHSPVCTAGGDFFGSLHADEQRRVEFLRAMQGIQMDNFLALWDRIDLSSVATLCRRGGE